jgi:hypothetical protein
LLLIVGCSAVRLFGCDTDLLLGCFAPLLPSARVLVSNA